MSESGKHSRSEKTRGRPVKWHRLTLAAVLLAGTAGFLSYTFFPGTVAAPIADRLSLSPEGFSAVALGGLLGQGQISSTAPLPAPVITATAKAPGARHTHSPRPTAHPTSPSGGASLADAAGLGIYDGDSSPTGIETAASWLGSSSSVKYAQDFIDATDFSHISNPWQLSNWQGSPFTMVWGVPMVPCGAPSTQCATNVSDYNLVANGGADGYYKTLAQNLVAAGFGSSYIRLGWEFNAGWMGWGVCNQDGSGLTSWAGDFVPAFRNIVTSMRSVSGANFKFIWNPINSSNSSCSGDNLENFYPGDSYVDTVALDVYDGIGQATSDAARWTDMLNGVNAGGYTSVTPAAINGQEFQGYGLNWLTAFGKEHDKQVGLPEWGLDSTSMDGGGGDDAYFMSQMANWIKANATGPAIFWNSGDGTLPLNIPNYTTDDTPTATAAFRAAFGA
jgi:Glycosyl hydrolase family 26